LVNGKRVDIPSYQVKPGNIISVSEKSQEHPVINSSLENTLNRPSYVSFDSKKKEGTYVRYPEREELNVDINESLIVEFYNR
ncbi:MAG: 30S ribosomal protein S4, partial [Bacilli bacterium]|nr:30S ribosomal protein S4 [Bacilli bacterium]